MLNEKDVEDVIDLYKTFDRFKRNSRQQLKTHIEQSFLLNQYKLHFQDDKLVAFTNWAFMSEEHSEHYKKTGQMLFHFWNSGNICWHIDTVSSANIVTVHRWTRDYFTSLLGVGGELNWLRTTDDFRVHKIKKWRYLGNGKYEY
tara:strand:+ start:3654 stop:4085 length:432 start_codon:yes stop_codon:yes gene_type:complete